MELPEDFYGKSAMEKEIRIIDRDKYKGRGRPKKTDYRQFTYKEAMAQLNSAVNDYYDRLDQELLEAFKAIS